MNYIKIILNKTLILNLTVFLLITISCNSQEPNLKFLTKSNKKVLIDSISNLVKTYYVSLETGEKMSSFLTAKLKNGDYDTISQPKVLASQLTSDLRSVNGDLHMSVNYNPSNHSNINKTKTIDKKGKWSNYGFQEIKILDGNIGYLKINHFTNWNNFEKAKKVITSSINYLNSTESLIIDVRNNPGGFEEIVAYLISYFFDGKKIHLSDYYYRYKDERYGIWTKEDVSGKKLPNLPLYVLVNSRSGSAAESLAYMLKHLKRATIVGETTMGAGNGAMTHHLNSNFTVTIASEATINAITKTSFEQVGVIPNIKVTSEEAFNKAYIMALNHLKEINKNRIPTTNYDKIIEFIPIKKNRQSIDKSFLEKFVGSYKGNSMELKITLNKSGLNGEMIGRQSKFKLLHKSENIFIVEGLKERVEFLVNNSGNVISLKGIDSPMKLDKIIAKQ